MKPDELLRPDFTVPNYHQQLTATRPIQVYTYFWGTMPASGIPPRAPATPPSAPVHVFEGATRLVPHDHEHCEFALVLSGRAVHRTSQNSRPIQEGSVIIVAPSDVHALENIRQLWLVNCTYLTEYLFYEPREILSVDGLAPLFFHGAIVGGGTRAQVPQWNISRRLLEKCILELQDIAAERARPDASPVFMRRTLEKLMLLLHRSHAESEEPPHIPVDAKIRQVVEVIEETIESGEPFSAAGLALEMGLSRDYLAQWFKRATGYTPTGYYQHRRVQQACRLLLDRSTCLTTIAQELGYHDSAHFSRVFKQYRGISPKTFQLRYAD